MESLFHPVTAKWFRERYGEPTEPQALAWPLIARGDHVLIAAPTGSGKTFAAFLACLDDLLRQSIAGTLRQEVQVLYVSPLKALSNDIKRNLEEPLAELLDRSLELGTDHLPISAALRTGDTTANERAKILRNPPHILVTTPESLYLLLTSGKGRNILKTVRTLIVDEIHALARDKRGSHFALSVERLEHLVPEKLTRIGLSATQRPMDEIARFLVGSKNLRPDGSANCHIVNTGHARQLDINVVVPGRELESVCSKETWGEVYAQLVEHINSHRSTIVFVNTRRLAERVSHQLGELLGAESVAGHHGSLSKEIRLHAEEKLKSGELKAIVATASLELGIDVGYVDLVCQLSSPRSIATFLQRVGRAGHRLGAIPKGRLFPLTRDDLVESAALLRSVRQGRLDAIEIPRQPLDILSQQIVASVAVEEWNEEELFELVRSAWPYHDMTRDQFEEVVSMISERPGRSVRDGVTLHRDRIHGKLRAPRGAKIVATTCGGAIPEVGDYRVTLEGEGTFIGTVNEDFAIESLAGDIFLLGNSSWQIVQVRASEVVVRDAQGAPANIPFWLGESPGRTVELSAEVSALREEIQKRVEVQLPAEDDEPSLFAETAHLEEALVFLREEVGVTGWSAVQVARYIAAQKAAVGCVPTQNRVVFERFFDDTGGMQLVIHAPFGARINRAWGLAMRKRFCRSFDFELQAAADNDGVVLSLGPQHSFPLDMMFSLLKSNQAEHILQQALLAAPMFRLRWRWNAQRALAVLRQRGGKRVPPPLQRFRADDFLTAVFPAQTACLENRPEDIEIPDHPLVQQTVYDCMTEAMDFVRWIDLLRRHEQGEVEFVGVDTREPSPFSHELLNANPYAFLDDAPLEERRARAVATRRSLQPADVANLAVLDESAIELVRQQAWPTVRSADEMHETLEQIYLLGGEEGVAWREHLEELVNAGRATLAKLPSGNRYWISAESSRMVRELFPQVDFEPALSLPPSLLAEPLPDQPTIIKMIVRGRLDISGPITTDDLSRLLSIAESDINVSLAALELEGSVLQGHYSAKSRETKQIEWCDRRLLARIHRQTLDRARRAVEPVSAGDFWTFLANYHGLHQRSESSKDGESNGENEQAPAENVLSELSSDADITEGVRRAIHQLAGFESPAGAWEYDLLPSRVADYEPAMLDDLCLAGDVSWGRLQPRRYSDDGPARGTPMTRVVPISLFLREDLAWLLPTDAEEDLALVKGDADLVLETLAKGGAAFAKDLLNLTGLLPSQLESALSELASAGRITNDSFAAIRAIASPDRRSNRTGRPGRWRSRTHGPAARGGRWAMFPGPFIPATQDVRIQRWAWLLLKRYGVIFRDLLARESVAPPWRELARCYRMLEMRGEVRGGRFIAGVAGEQFALPGVVEKLRKFRSAGQDHEFVISACDPLNLAGILVSGARVPAQRGNRLLVRAGKVLASLEAGDIKFHEKVDANESKRITELLERSAVVRGHDAASVAVGK